MHVVYQQLNVSGTIAHPGEIIRMAFNEHLHSVSKHEGAAHVFNLRLTTSGHLMLLRWPLGWSRCRLLLVQDDDTVHRKAPVEIHIGKPLDVTDYLGLTNGCIIDPHRRRSIKLARRSYPRVARSLDLYCNGFNGASKLTDSAAPVNRETVLKLWEELTGGSIPLTHTMEVLLAIGLKVLKTRRQ